MHYRWKTGMLAWVLFRLTGLALILYLSMHIWVISNLHDREKFDLVMNFLGSWQFRLLEIGLFIAVIYHALNGVRIMIVDFWGGAVHQARIFWILAVIGFILFIAGAYPMFKHTLHWMQSSKGIARHTTLVGAPADSPFTLEAHNV